MNKEELIVELECNDVQVNIDDTRITYCNSLDKELVKAIYNLQQENKQLQKELDKYKRLIEYLKTLNLFEFDLDYDYYDEPIKNYYPADLGEHINDWFEYEEEEEEND